MSILTQNQLDSLLEEMGPMVATEESRTELGMGVYRTLRGLPLESALDSDGIRYYGLSLCNSLVSMIMASTDATESAKLFAESAELHKERNVTRNHFYEGMPIIMEFLLAAIQKPENKATLEEFLRHIFPTIAEQM